MKLIKPIPAERVKKILGHIDAAASSLIRSVETYESQIAGIKRNLDITREALDRAKRLDSPAWIPFVQIKAHLHTGVAYVIRESYNGERDGDSMAGLWTGTQWLCPCHHDVYTPAPETKIKVLYEQRES